MTETNITLPAIHTDKIIEGYKATFHRLEPIQVQAGWKGRIVSFGEAIQRRFTQIVELFKTGQWTVEGQVRVKIERDYKQLNKLVTDWEGDLFSKASSVRAMKFDRAMRKDLNARLHDMGYIVNKALGNKPEDKKLESLKQFLETELQNNDDAISTEEKHLKQAENGVSVFKEAAAKAAYKAESKKNEAYEARLKQLRAENEIHNPTNGVEIYKPFGEGSQSYKIYGNALISKLYRTVSNAINSVNYLE